MLLDTFVTYDPGCSGRDHFKRVARVGSHRRALGNLHRLLPSATSPIHLCRHSGCRKKSNGCCENLTREQERSPADLFLVPRTHHQRTACREIRQDPRQRVCLSPATYHTQCTEVSNVRKTSIPRGVHSRSLVLLSGKFPLPNALVQLRAIQLSSIQPND